MTAALLLSIMLLTSDAAPLKRRDQGHDDMSIDLMQILNGTTNYYSSSMLDPVKVETQWSIKRQRFLTGDMTATEQSLYVSQNKAPVFILGAMKGGEMQCNQV